MADVIGSGHAGFDPLGANENTNLSNVQKDATIDVIEDVGSGKVYYWMDTEGKKHAGNEANYKDAYGSLDIEGKEYSDSINSEATNNQEKLAALKKYRTDIKIRDAKAAASIKAAASKAAGKAFREKMLNTLKQRQRFEEAQMIQWEKSFGGIQQNLSEYYNTMTPEKLASKRIARQREMYQETMQNMDRNLAQRGITGPASDSLRANMELQSAQQQAEIRDQAGLDLAQGQQQFVASVRENPFASRVSQAMGGVAQGENIQASDEFAEAGTQTAQMNRLVSQGFQNDYYTVNRLNQQGAQQRAYQQQLHQQNQARRNQNRNDFIKLGAYAAGAYFAPATGGASLALAGVATDQYDRRNVYTPQESAVGSGYDPYQESAVDYQYTGNVG